MLHFEGASIRTSNLVNIGYSTRSLYAINAIIYQLLVHGSSVQMLKKLRRLLVIS